MKFFLALFLLVAVVAADNQGDLLKLLTKLPKNGSLKDNEDFTQALANYACDASNCMPFMPEVCPFAFLCQLYCEQQGEVGLCGNNKCGCIDAGTKKS